MSFKTKIIAKHFLSALILVVMVVPFFAGAATFVPSNPAGISNFTTIIRSLLNYLLIFIGIAAVLGFVVAGIMYITAAGDEDRVKSAKNMMLYSIIGIVVALIGYAVVNLVFGIMKSGSTGETDL
jgi:hypothetical protein